MHKEIKIIEDIYKIKCKEKSVNYKRKRIKLSMHVSRQQGLAGDWF